MKYITYQILEENLRKCYNFLNLEETHLQGQGIRLHLKNEIHNLSNLGGKFKKML